MVEDLYGIRHGDEISSLTHSLFLPLLDIRLTDDGL